MVFTVFSGFSPETFDFLWGIRMNNNREWFLAHKEQYTACLYEPMKALGQELFRPFLDRPGNLLKVSRIYRDARMHPPEPYKESLWICIRRDVEWWAQAPCLFFEITPEGASYGLLLWQPSTAYLERFRQRISGQPEPFLKLVTSAEKSTGTAVTAQLYKRPKVPENPALAPYFAWKGGIGCIRELAPGPELFSPGLAEEVRDFFQKLIPLYDYLCNIS